MRKETWNNNLRALRTERGLTQQQVAALLGHKSNDQVSHWEKGQLVPSLKNLVKLSRLYGADIERLLK